MTWVLIVTVITVWNASQYSVPGFVNLEQCRAAGKQEVASADGLNIVKTFNCAPQG